MDNAPCLQTDTHKPQPKHSPMSWISLLLDMDNEPAGQIVRHSWHSVHFWGFIFTIKREG